MTTNDVAERELSRFLALAAASGEDCAFLMPTCEVDEYWHRLLSQPEAYLAFCDRVAGAPVEHIQRGGIARLPWVELYHARHGELPRIWFQDDNAYASYQRTGEVLASWDCSPEVQSQRDRTDRNRRRQTPSTVHAGA